MIQELYRSLYMDHNSDVCLSVLLIVFFLVLLIHWEYSTSQGSIISATVHKLILWGKSCTKLQRSIFFTEIHFLCLWQIAFVKSRGGFVNIAIQFCCPLLPLFCSGQVSNIAFVKGFLFIQQKVQDETISKLQSCQISMQPGQMILSQFAILLCMEFVRFYIYVPTVYKRPLFPLSLHKSIMALEKTWSSQSMLCIAIIIVASLWIGCEILLASNFCVLWICGFSK